LKDENVNAKKIQDKLKNDISNLENNADVLNKDKKQLDSQIKN